MKYVEVVPKSKKRKGAHISADARPVLTRVVGPSMSIAPRSGGFVPLKSWHQGLEIRGETKSVDFPTTQSSFPLNAATGNLACLNLISAGSSFFNRIGRKIALQSIYLNGDIQSGTDPAVSLAQEYLRIIVVYDAQTNGATPVWSDVVQATTQANVTSSLARDGFNLNNRDRFKIIINKRFITPETTAAGINATGGAVTPTMNEYTIQEYRKLNNMETQYKADSSPAVIGDVATGGLFLLVQGSTGGQWLLNWTCRIRYTDN